MEARTLKIGNSTIIIRESTPNEQDIRRCFDVCNELFRGKPECFYTREETREKNKTLVKKEAIN